MATETPQAVEWNCSSEDYHADHTRIGHSMFEVFVESQINYRNIYVTHTKPQPKMSEALQLGIWCHLALLEPDIWKRDYIFDLPAKASDGLDWNWRKPAHRAERDELLGERPKMLTIEQRTLVEAMRDAVMNNDDARTLMQLPGLIEHGYHWQDESGLILKSRPDKIIGDVLPDLKSCIDASPEGFTNASRRLGYHRTAAWRCAGHYAMTGRVPRYLFIAVSKKTLDVGVHELGEDELALGMAQNRMYLNRMAKCYETGDWTPWWGKGVNCLTYPKHDFNNEWEIEDEHGESEQSE
jgi:hypothetical protein